MTSRLAARLALARRPGFFLFWVALVNIVWDPASVWQHSGLQPLPTTKQQDPSKQQDPFDLRFPVAIDSGPTGTSLERDPNPIDTQSMPLPSKSPSVLAATPPVVRRVDPPKLRRIMDLGVAQFASAADDGGKSKGASLVQLSALLGYPPARELVVRNYQRSPIVRSRVPAQDAVRYAVELVAQGASASSGAAEVTIALGNYFSQRGDMPRFARHVVDAISDDDRLQSPDQLARLFSVIARIPGACVGIKQMISSHLSIDQDECSNSLKDELLGYARSNGEVGINREGRLRAMRLLDEVEGTLK
jgi:hypothetical protein